MSAAPALALVSSLISPRLIVGERTIQFTLAQGPALAAVAVWMGESLGPGQRQTPLTPCPAVPDLSREGGADPQRSLFRGGRSWWKKVLSKSVLNTAAGVCVLRRGRKVCPEEALERWASRLKALVGHSGAECSAHPTATLSGSQPARHR